MSLDTIENSLPNGFHDAVLRSYTYSLHSKSISMELDILVGGPDDPPGKMDDYKAGMLTFENVSSLVGPDYESLNLQNGPSGVVVADGQNPFRFFVIEWQSSLKIVAESVSFAWL